MFLQIGIQPQDQKIYVFCGQRMAVTGSSNTITSSLAPHFHFLFQPLYDLQNFEIDQTKEHLEADTSIMQQFYLNYFLHTYTSEKRARSSAEHNKTVLQTGGFKLKKPKQSCFGKPKQPFLVRRGTPRRIN